ncbi:hypothetical protein NAP1_03980 [Erythrobacter sp. NAP1]|uniref:hypothetical protein n=1 Tax=Erythrobacter sp. NAP1 TaxID=237727 RepID=UPI0000686ED9|nr:hypothetical protein [Erythrobacter sp. NAP1]EAQ29902.1 hypothetical protein NAP1_03980 [Erythrobacter sp. NAP1]
MSFSLLAAVGAIALPQINPVDVLRAADELPIARRDSGFSTEVLLFVDDEGGVIECTPQRTEGSAILARQLCRLLERVEVLPATAKDGAPVHGVTSTKVNLDPGKDQAGVIRETPDIAFALPSTEFSGMVNALVEVDETGRVTGCVGAASFDNPTQQDTALVCDFLSSVPLGTMNGSDQTAVPYVRMIKVLLNR